MSAQLFYLPFNPAFTSNGLPAAGATLTFYLTGTSTPSPVFTAADLATEHPNPLSANGAGRFPAIYLDSSVTYRLVIQDRHGEVLDAIDPYTPGAEMKGDKGDKGDPGDMVADYKVKTPYQAPYNCTGATDYSDTTKLQAFLAAYSLALRTSNSPIYTWDATGEWYVNNKMIIAGANSDADISPQILLGGTLRVAPLSQLATPNVPLDFAMDIAGYQQTCLSPWKVFPADAVGNGTNYKYSGTDAVRSYYTAFRLRAIGYSTFSGWEFADAKQHGVLDDGTAGTFVLGGVTYINANNIGAKLGPIRGRYFGTYGRGSRDHSQVITAITNAGTAFSPTTQRSTVTVASTARFLPGAQLTVADSVAPSFYGTVTFTASTRRVRFASGTLSERYNVGDIFYPDRGSNIGVTFTVTAMVPDTAPGYYGVLTFTAGTKKIAFSTGNPSTRYAVGDAFRPSTGLNAGTIFTVAAVSATEITTNETPVAETTSAPTLIGMEMAVTPAPVNETSTTALLIGDASVHTIESVPNGAQAVVWPWVPSRMLNQTAWLMSGYAFVTKGGDTASTEAGPVEVIYGNGLVWASSLYLSNVTTALSDFANTGFRLGGTTLGSSQYGLGQKVSQVHLEATTYNVWFHSSLSGIDVSGASNFYPYACTGDRLRATANDMRGTLFGTPAFSTFIVNGKIYTAGNQSGFEGANYGQWTLSNTPGNQDRFVHANSATVPFDFDEAHAEKWAINHHCKLKWTGPAGAAPTGTLAIGLPQHLIDKGWTYGGAWSGTSGSITAPGTNVRLEFEGLSLNKKIAVTRYNGA
jgi:hypothetical protein